MKIKSNTHLLIFFVLVSVGTLGIIITVKGTARPGAFFGSDNGATHTIVLTKDGFSPPILNIKKGDVVKFVTSRGKHFWPASDLHPTHGIMPEFDPQKPIQPDESWSFKFKETGTWKYHDHLYPGFRGIVAVAVDEGSNLKNVTEECRGNANKIICWEKAIDAELKKFGLGAAFDLVASLYEAEPVFASECHGHVHKLGEAAYDKFAAGKDFDLTPKVAYCGYGFFHGFMEKLLWTSGDFGEARKFCGYVDEKLRGKRSGASTACFHGFGHGTIDGSDPTLWGDAGKMTEPGIALCEKVAESKLQLYVCVTGVFNSIEILSLEPKYKINIINEDPFAICHDQKLSYREPCYTNMAPALLRFVSNDFLKASRYIEKEIRDPHILTIDDFKVGDMVMLSLWHEFIRVNLASPDYNAETGVRICHELQEKSRIPCIMGLAGGHMKYGKPNEEYVKAFEFCSSSFLKSDEAIACFGYILPRLGNLYSPNRVKEICGEAPEVYRKKHCGL